jgi:2-(1,2-epoxy-1,2-dihydrophenyl)acetyl-CoA isomerase
MNAFDATQVCELRGAVRDAGESSSIRALILTGNGGNFCAGADLKRDREAEQRAGIDILGVMQEVYLQMRFGTKPSVAAVSGYALGAGLSLALACDFVLADASARFGASFTSVGLAPDVGITRTLPERVGIGVAREMLLLGAQKTASEAASIGLIDTLCEPGQVRSSAIEKALALAERAPLAISATRALLAGRREDVESALQQELRLQISLRPTLDAKEAALAFAQKRRPVFQGR